jgi:hypothetical protein
MLNSLKGLIGPFGDADLVRIMRGTGADGQQSDAALPHDEFSTEPLLTHRSVSAGKRFPILAKRT